MKDLYSWLNLKRVCEKLALQNLLVLDEMEETQRQVAFLSARVDSISKGGETCEDTVSLDQYAHS